MNGVLVLSGIEKTFGANAVLRGVTTTIESGKVHALLGENGAGKSTLMRIVLGILPADAGSMTLSGAPYAPRTPKAARAAGVVMVPQERTLCPDLSVFENVVLGAEAHAGVFLRESRSRAVAEGVLHLVAGDRIPLDVRARSLSVADQQLVEIARALVHGGAQRDGGITARVLVLDEPTASLGRDDSARLFARVEAMKETGLAVILVTHFLADVRDHADRYTVLRDGRVQGEGNPKDTPPERIVHEMLGRELEGAMRESADASASASAAPSEALLEVEGLSGIRKPRHATFTVGRGEILGIAGLVGSGRTELLRAVAGLDRRQRGEVRVRGKRGLGLLSEDRGGEGLMLGRSIAENVTLSAHAPFVVLPRQMAREAARWLSELSIRASGPEEPVGHLSGGNQQKVQIARLLREDYDVLLVDEPTRGIDVGSKAQVLSILRELAARGKAIVLVSSQFDELRAACDRIAVLRRGELGPPRAATDWTDEGLLLEASS